MTRTARSSITGLLRRLHRAGSTWGDEGRARLDADPPPRRPVPAEAGPAISRRRMLVGGAAAVAATSALGRAAPATALPSVPRVAIVGGGAAGLSCAHRLLRFRIPATVYEAQGRLGGRVFTSRDFFDDGAVVERGGEFISSEHRFTRRLAASLDLELEVVDGGGYVEGGEEAYWIDGAYYTAAEAQADWFDAKAWQVFHSAIKEAPYPPTFDDHTPGHVRLDHLPLPAWLDEVGIGASTRLGRLLQTDAMVEYGPAPGEQTCLNLVYIVGWNGPSLQPLAGTDERFHIVGGNDQLIDRAAAALPPSAIQLGRPLEAIHGAPGGPYQLSFAGGAVDVVDVLVLALPFTTLRDVHIDPGILGSFRPAKRRAISDLFLGPNAKLHVQTNGRPWVQPLGQTGVVGNGVVYSDPDDFVCTWDATTTDTTTSSPVLVNFLGGELGKSPHQQVPFGPAHPDDVDRFLGQIEPVFPGTSAAFNALALGSFWAQHPWSHGAYFSPLLGDYTSFFGAPGLPEGNIHFCGEHTEMDAFGFIEGAVRTGELVAGEIHRRMRG